MKSIILLGNGINRCFNGSSWDDYLKELAVDKNDKYLDDNGPNIPMSYKPILLTRGDVHKQIEKTRYSLNINVKDAEMKEMIQSVLDIGCLDILTTNYGYELESVAFGVTKISDYQLKHHLLRDSKKPDGSINIYEHYRFNEDVNKNNIWHIHGEIRKPSSMILGHYYYGNLIHRIKEWSKGREYSYQFLQNNNIELKQRTWIDSFILNDVYILGFGLDFAEIDLWWLINRKQREKAKHGKIFFFDIRKESEKNDKNKNVITDLLQIFIDKDVDDNGYKGEIIPIYVNKNKEYKQAYREAIEDIKKRIG